MIKDEESQKRSLKAIFLSPSFAPLFKRNPKHCVDKFADLTPYISYRDLVDNKLFIRGCPIGFGNTSDSGQREIIAEYSSIDELIDDGWQLESPTNPVFSLLS